jgi:hypothetical protein
MASGRNAKKWHMKAVIIFGGLLVATGLAAAVLTINAFPDNASIPKQISVTVYVEKAPVQLLIKSFVYNADPAADSVEVTVLDRKGTAAVPSLLVVQCPDQSAYFRKHEKALVIEPRSNQKPVEAIVKPFTQRTWQSYLDCYAPPSGSGGTPGAAPSGQNINVAPPVLEANPAATLTPGFAPVFLEERAGQVVDAVEAVSAPGASCVGAAASASPNSAASACYTPVAENAEHTGYIIPNPATSQVTTIETLEDISLSGDQIESMVPDGHIISSDQVYWQGGADLSPSLSAANLNSERVDSWFIFAAGIAVGFFASVMLTILQEVLPLTHDQQADESGSSAPAR